MKYVNPYSVSTIEERYLIVKENLVLAERTADEMKRMVALLKKAGCPCKEVIVYNYKDILITVGTGGEAGFFISHAILGHNHRLRLLTEEHYAAVALEYEITPADLPNYYKPYLGANRRGAKPSKNPREGETFRGFLLSLFFAICLIFIWHSDLLY